MNSPGNAEKKDIKGFTWVESLDEDDVDFNALKTIECDCPDFIIPFTHKKIDGRMEFTYNLNGLAKMRHFSGMKSKDEYLDMWNGIINPIIECEDWFMEPSSFLFDIDKIYIEQRGNKTSYKYIYIPNMNSSFSNDDLKAFLAEIENMYSTDSSELSHSVLRAITAREFNITEYKKIINNFRYGKNTGADTAVPVSAARIQEEIEYNNNAGAAEAVRKEKEKDEITVKIKNKKEDADEIVIKTKQKGEKNKNKGKGLFGGVFAKKNDHDKEFADGAFAESSDDGNSYDPAPVNHFQSVPEEFEDDGMTEIFEEKEIRAQAVLKLVGKKDFPESISLDFSGKDAFSIGRFDGKSGIKQSDFEFEGKIKSISRRQAVIEKAYDSYAIICIGSAKIYVNGKSLSRGETMRITTGDKISFGTIGADYIFST